MEIEAIKAITSKIADQLNSGFYSKQSVFIDNFESIKRLTDSISLLTLTKLLNERLDKNISYDHVRKLFYISKKRSINKVLIKEEITQNNLESQHIITKKKQTQTNNNNPAESTEIKFKEEWKNQLNITGEFCMKKLEKLGLTPNQVSEWGVIGDDAIIKEMVNYQSRKRR